MTITKQQQQQQQQQRPSSHTTTAAAAAAEVAPASATRPYPPYYPYYRYRGGYSTSICKDLFAPSSAITSHNDNEQQQLLRRSDCCALTCCGMLLYDRNVFLLTNKRPSWKNRCCKFLLLLVLILLWFIGMVLYALTGTTKVPLSSSDTDTENMEWSSSTSTSSSSSSSKSGSGSTKERYYPVVEHKSSSSSSSSSATTSSFHEDLHTVESILFWLIVFLSFYYLYQAAMHRFRIRSQLMERMYRERLYQEHIHNHDNNQDTETAAPAPATTTTSNNATSTTPLITNISGIAGQASVQTFLKQQSKYIRKTTATVSCISNDVLFVDEEEDEEIRQNNNNNNSKGADFCYCLWKTLMSMCCGACCGCWCQCCGICATAQDGRELQVMMPKERFQIDFITFQPFQDYAPKLETLRRDNINNMFQHMKEISLLSKNLLLVFFTTLIAFTLIAFSGIDPFFQPIQLLVVFMVFLQAFIIIYFVHWQFNRFDLSFDAIVKYFASGFILCTTNAFVYEILVSMALKFGGTIIQLLILMFMILTGRIEDGGGMKEEYSGGVDGSISTSHNSFSSSNNGSDDDAASPDEATVPVWVLAIVAFLNAFAVAALVEEISKYFGFWMVEHPDLPLPEDGENETTVALIGYENTDSSAQQEQQQQQRAQRSFSSVGAGITVAMVTTAVGFACCENFIYVFFYSRPASAVTEISTLIVRSIFPVHPLAAAIQSIGVCRRDLEKDGSIGLGWILFPALLLHGSFDFSLMFLDLLIHSSESSADGSDTDDDNFTPSTVGTSSNKNGPGGSIDDPSIRNASSLSQMVPGIISSVVIVFIGIIYYVVKAIAQRRRLKALDKERRGGNYEQLD